MPIKYYKLFDLLNRRGMKKTDLLNIISAPTLAKLSKGKTVTTEVIAKICEFLNCDVEDIMEYIPENSISSNAENIESKNTTPETPLLIDDIPAFMHPDYVEPPKEKQPTPEPQCSDPEDDFIPEFMREDYVPPKKEPAPPKDTGELDGYIPEWMLGGEE